MKSLNSKQIIDAVAKISDAMISDLYLEEILKLIVTVTAEVMHSKICSLMLLDKKTQELVVKASQSVSDFYNKKPNVRLGEGIAGRVAQTGKYETVPDVRKEPRYISREVAVKEHLCSLLCLPLFFKGEIIGVLNCYTVTPHQFTKSEIDILRSIANQAAIVIENFKLVVESQVMKDELAARKAVERAKGILMKRQRFSEQQAYEALRKYSMDKRRSMKEIAEAVILNEEMGKVAV